MVAQTFLLFIGTVVLFVDNDQPRVFHRGEQRRACADNNVGFAIPSRQPAFEALAVVDRRMHQGDTGIEALFEAGQGLRAKVDLGDQHQRLLAGLQGFADQLQIHFGLAAASDPGQQEGMEVVEACANGFIGCLLLSVERQFGLGQPMFMALAGRMAANLDRDQLFGQQQVEAVLAQHQLA